MIGPRLRANIIKEALAVLRDRRARILLFGPPLVQLLVFAFASTMEIESVRIGVRNLDNGQWSREIVSRIAAAPMVGAIVPLGSDRDMERAIAKGEVIAALRFDENFSRNVAAGQTAVVGAIYDGRRSNASQLLESYVRAIVTGTGVEIAESKRPLGGEAVVRHLYNPNVSQLWYVMPTLVAIIAAISVMALVTQSVAREHEIGTFDQLRVSPLKTHEILIGKMVPSIVVGLLNTTAFVILLPTVFGIPLVGSLTQFFFALIFYLLALTGLGMIISCLARTQQQAFLGMFTILIPMIILSGYAGPIDNMPRILQVLSWFNPIAWFLEISQGTFLKGMSVGLALGNTWPIALIACGTIAASVVLFRRQMR